MEKRGVNVDHATLKTLRAGRLHSSTLDLLVAVLSGVAGAFANARESIAKSLPGVAIAVALVPPLYGGNFLHICKR
jgi:uncharacterized membrane protein